MRRRKRLADSPRSGSVINRPPFDFDLAIDEKGQGKFNALPLFYRLKSVIDKAFAPTDTEAARYSDHNEVTLAQAKQVLFQATTKDREKCYREGEKRLFQAFKTEFAPQIEIELRKLAENVALSTLAHLTSDLKPGLRTKARAGSRALRKLDRWRLGRSGPGRPRNSKTRKSENEIRDTAEQRKNKILGSMSRLFAEGLARETKRAVAVDLQLSRRTIDNWLREHEWAWEDLLAESRKGSANSR